MSVEENQQASNEEQLDEHEEQSELETGETPEADEASDSETEGELVVSFGEEQQQEEQKESAPAWVKELRKQNREQAKKLKEFEQREAERNKPKEQALREKPKLADFDYDAEAFETDLLKWSDEKKAVESQAEKVRLKKEQQDKEWNEKVHTFESSAKALKAADYEEKLDEVRTQLNEMQQGIILDACESPSSAAAFVYGLGSNHVELEKLKNIENPVKFAAAVARLEKTMKQSTRRSPPPAEKVVTGNRAHAGSYDKELEKLREEAQKTGDYSKVTAFKKKLNKP